MLGRRRVELLGDSEEEGHVEDEATGHEPQGSTQIDGNELV